MSRAELRLVVGWAILALLAPAIEAQNLSSRPDDPTDPLINQGPKAEAVGEKVMVSTQTPRVTEAALDVLRQGGNAFDAFVTAVLLQQVTEPHMVSHWGVISGLIYDAESGTYRAFDGIGGRPLASRGEGGDPMKVSVGGTVKALGDIWKQYGSIPWERCFDPAIQAAEEGVLVTSFMYGIIYAAWENSEAMWPEGVRDLLDNEEAREFYRPGGFQVPVGARWKMPRVAAHMRRLAVEGPDYMYTGEWAERFVEKSNDLGGRVSMEDMAEYEVAWREPLRFSYKGHDIVSEAPPITGGLMVGYGLNILEEFDLAGLGHFSESAEALDIMVRTSDRVFWEVGRLRDPQNFSTPTELLLSKEYGRMAAEYVRNTMILPGVDLTPPKGEESDAATPAQARSHDSNHNVIVDARGNWITSLHSGHGGTPGFFFDGVEANGSTVRSDSMGPGRRMIAPLAATFVLKDGEPWLALGTPGLPPQPVTEVLVNILEYGMHPREAAAAPRFWQPADDGTSVRIESRLSEAARKGMTARGFEVVSLAEYDWHTGSFQIVWRDAETGRLHGVSDPRRLGYAEGF